MYQKCYRNVRAGLLGKEEKGCKGRKKNTLLPFFLIFAKLTNLRFVSQATKTFSFPYIFPLHPKRKWVLEGGERMLGINVTKMLEGSQKSLLLIFSKRKHIPFGQTKLSILLVGVFFSLEIGKPPFLHPKGC